MLLKNEHLVSFVSLKPTYANVMIIIISLSEILHILSKSTKLQFQAFSLMKLQIGSISPTSQLNPTSIFMLQIIFAEWRSVIFASVCNL